MRNVSATALTREPRKVSNSDVNEIYLCTCSWNKEMSLENIGCSQKEGVKSSGILKWCLAFFAVLQNYWRYKKIYHTKVLQ